MAVIKFPGSGSGRTFEYQDADADYEEYEESGPVDFIDEGEDESLSGMTTEEAAERRKARRRRVLQAAGRVLIGAAVVGVLGLLIYHQQRTGTYSSAAYQSIAEAQAADGTQYVMLGSHIVSYSRDGVSCMKMDGTQVYNITFEMQQPLAERSGDVLALADLNGSTIIILSPDEELGTVSTSLPIRQISVSESGEVAAVVDDQDVTWIYLYSSSGDTIAYFKTTMGQSGYPLDVAISPNGALVAISHLLASDDGADSSIAFYNFGGVGANVVENNVGGFNYNNEIYPYIRFMNDATCVAVSDMRIAYYTGSEIPQSGQDIILPGQALGVWSNDKYLAVLFSDTTGEQYNMKVYGTNGTQIGDFSFTLDYSQIQLAGDRIYINNAQECMIYTTSGVRKYNGTFNEDVRYLVPSVESHTHHVIVTDDGIKEMRLQ